MSIPSFFVPSVGASVPSTSMYATGSRRSRPRPRHNRGRTALMHSINSITSASAKRRVKSSAAVGLGISSASRASM